MRNLTLILCLLALTCWGEIIPSGRRATWTGNVGVSNGIPDSSTKTVYTTLAAGSSRATVQTALGDCPANQVVELASGAYSWSTTLSWQGVNPGVVLRGAGMGSTVITFSDFDSYAIHFQGPFSEAAYGQEANLDQDAVKGESTVHLASIPAWVTVGDLIYVDQIDDSTNAMGDPGGYRTLVTGEDRGMGQANRVLAKTSTTITLEIPNLWSFQTAHTAQISQMGYDPSSSEPLRGNGLENLTLAFTTRTWWTDAHPIEMQMCDQCYVKNVEVSNMGAGRGVWCVNSFRCEFRGMYIHDSQNYDGGQGYGIDLYSGTSSCLVEDCILYHLHAGLTTRFGSSGHAFIYNYYKGAANPSVHSVALATHGDHTMFNLYEGNWVDEKFLADRTQAGGIPQDSSGFNTLFRNRIEGRVFSTGGGNDVAVSIDEHNRYYNVIGNILGVDGHQDVYRVNHSNQSEGSVGSIYFLGAFDELGDPWSTWDADSTNSGLFIITHGNYDTVNNSQFWEGTIADQTLPNSYIYTSKPSNFGFLSWPPFNAGSYSAATISGTNIPAGYRYINGTNPPAGGESGGSAVRAMNAGRVTVGRIGP